MSSIASSPQTMPLHLPDEPDCSLPSITMQRLIEYRRRRTTQNFCRGLGIVCCASILTLLLAIILDALIPNVAARWLGSLAFYTVTLVGAYWFCLRPILSPVSLLEEARRMEASDDRLVERLVPAIELSEQAAIGDSAAFRQQLQRQVAQLISPIDVRNLLPWQAIRWTALAGAVAAFGLIVLSLLPWLHMPHRIARTLLPAADLGRVSRIAISIEAPMPNSTLVPFDDLVGIVARVEGPQPDLVILEKRSDQSEIEQLPLAPSQTTNRPADSEHTLGDSSQESRFETVVSVASGWLEYRVKAEGAETPWHRLTGRPRPKIAAFLKTVTGPQYTRKATLHVSEEHGDVEALIGSHVRLELELNMPVSEATLEWIDGQSPAASLKLDANHHTIMEHDADSSRVFVEFDVESNAEYRVHLTARETGFTNAFSPTFSITAVTDAPPSLAWIRPQSQSVVVGRDQLLDLQMKVEDELPLKSLTQNIRVVNSQADAGQEIWQEAPLELPEQNAPLAWNLDLLPLKLNAGDFLELKVIGADRKGQTAESSVVRLMISTTSIDIAETAAERMRQEIASELESLADDLSRTETEVTAVEELKAIRERLVKDRKQAPHEDDVLGLEKKVNHFQAELEQHTGKLLGRIEQALANTDDAVSAMELRNAGELVTKLQAETTRVLTEKQRQLAANADSENGKQHRDLAIQLANSLEQSYRSVDEIAEDFRAMVSHDVLSRRAMQLNNLAEAESKLSDAAEQGSDSPETLQRQQKILSRQLVELQQQLRSTTGIRKEAANRLLSVADEMNWMIEQADRLDGRPSSQELQQVATSISASLKQKRLMQQLDGGVANMIKAAWRRTNDRSGAADDSIEQWAASLKDNSARSAQAAEVSAQLEARRTLQRTGRGADREFASDLGKARRALTRIAADESSSRQQKAEQVQAVGTSVATLSANTAVTEAANLLNELTRGESWSLDKPEARTEHPRIWEAYTARLEQAVNKLRDARVSNEIVAKLDQMRWSPTARRAAEKIVERHWRAEPVVSAAAELQQLAAEMEEVKGMLSSIASEARQSIEDVTPTLSELASQAAESTRQVQEQTGQLADEVERKQVPDTEARLETLQRELSGLQPPMSELREALVDQADAQNLLETREMQLARQADAAIGIVDRAEEQVERSLAPVREQLSSSPDLQATSLSKASEKQADAAAALEQLAKHFEQIEQMPDDAVTAEEASKRLAELEELADSMAEESDRLGSSPNYDEAEQLAKLNEASPQEMMRQLEQQLKTDTTMQQEMSQIARSAAQQALDGLEHAAERQSELQLALESSDPIMQAQRELLQHDLAAVRQQTQRLLDALVRESRSTAASGKQPVQERQLREVEERLEETLRGLAEIDAKATFNEMRDAAASLSESLDGAAHVLAEKGRELDAAKSKEVHRNDADLNNRRREMRDRQRRLQQQEVRAAQQAENHQRQVLNRAESSLRQSEQRIKTERQRLEQANKQAAKQPEQKHLQQQVALLEQKVAMAEADQKARETLRDAMKQRADSAKQTSQSINQEKQSALDSVNPSAELASVLAARAAERSQQIVDSLEGWGRGKPAQTQASEQQLASAAERQQEVGQEVDAAADALARASRHENRLGQQATSDKLGQLAQNTEQLNQQEIPAAQQQLSAAQNDAQENGSPTRQASASASESAASAIATAEAAIEQSAGDVRSMLMQKPSLPMAASAENAQANGSAGDPSSPSNQSGQAGSGKQADSDTPLSSQQMAQLLDELDRQMNDQQSLGQQDNNQNQAGSDASAGGATPSTLAEAAKKLASSMSESRQPPSQPASSDIGMATEGLMANAAPQPPVAVRVLDIERIDGDWGQLREQSAEEMIETRRDTLSPQVRRQVDAYFKILAERSQQSDSNAARPQKNKQN